MQLEVALPPSGMNVAVEKLDDTHPGFPTMVLTTPWGRGGLGGGLRQVSSKAAGYQGVRTCDINPSSQRGLQCPWLLQRHNSMHCFSIHVTPGAADCGGSGGRGGSSWRLRHVCRFKCCEVPCIRWMRCCCNAT